MTWEYLPFWANSSILDNPSFGATFSYWNTFLWNFSIILPFFWNLCPFILVPFLRVIKLPLPRFSYFNLSFSWTYSQKFIKGPLFCMYDVQNLKCSIFYKERVEYEMDKKRLWNLISRDFNWVAMSFISIICSCTFLDLWYSITNNLCIKVLANALSELTNCSLIAFM